MIKLRQFLPVLAILMALAGILAWQIPETRFSANVVDLLPDRDVEVRILKELADKEQGRQLTAVLSSSEGKVDTRAVRRFRESLLESTAVDQVWETDPGAFEQAGGVLFDNRYSWLLPGWLDEHYPDWRENGIPGSGELAVKVADELDLVLQSPDGFAMEGTIPNDPFLLLSRLSGIESLAPPEKTDKKAYLWVEQADSPFVSAGQEALFTAFAKALAAGREIQPSLEMDFTGVAVFAHESEKAIKGEIQRLNLMGLVFVLAFSVLVLRRIGEVLRISLVLVGALLGAAATVIVFFPSVHIIALVIGSILAGVAVDYAFHLILVERGGLSRRAVSRAVITGSVSSALGFIILVWAPLPFLRQVGTFVGTGLVTALLLALLLRPEEADHRLSENWRLRPFSLPRWTGPLLIILSLPAFFFIQFRDSISDLEYPLPEIEKRDQRIRNAASFLGDRELILVHAEDPVAARARLAEFTDSPEGRSSLDAGRWIPTLKKSRQAHSLFRAREDFSSVLMEQLEERGYVGEAFEPFLGQWNAYLAEPPDEALYEKAVTRFASALPGPLGNFLHAGEDIAWFGALVPKDTTVSGEGLMRLDQGAMLSESFSSYRRQVILFAGICGLAILVGLTAVYGPLWGVLSFTLPAVAVAMVLGISAVLHQGIGLFQIVGCLLAFCIALDYVIFAIQSHLNRVRLPASVTLSAISTLGVFSILATSRIPGVQQLALTVILCIGLALLLVLSGWPRVHGKSDSIHNVLDNLPHGREALFIKEILESGERTIRVKGKPFESGDVPSECLVEAMAQSAAAWLALSQGDNATKRFGMLVVVQQCSVVKPVLPAASPFICEVESQSEAREGFLMFDGRTTGPDGRDVLRATFSIFIPPGQEND